MHRTKRFPALLLALLMALGILSGCSQAPLVEPQVSSPAVVETLAPEAGTETLPPSEGEVLTTEAPTPAETPAPTGAPSLEDELPEDGSYTTPEDVSAYLVLYGHLPDNFITKNEARSRGWDNSKGNLWDVAPGMSIGGDRFGNREGILPEADGRRWTECDVNYSGGYRDAERIVFSNDGLIFYTDDHYKTFTQLYP